MADIDSISDIAPPALAIDPTVAAKIEKDIGSPVPVSLQLKRRLTGLSIDLKDDGTYAIAANRRNYITDGTAQYQEMHDSAFAADADLTKEVKDAITIIRAFALELP